MATTSEFKGASAVEAALSRARRHLGTASVAAALVPLSALSAHATVAAAPVAVSEVSSEVNGVFLDSYTFANQAGDPINEILIPEINVGDLNFNTNYNGSGAGNLLPTGWFAQSTQTQILAGAALRSGAAADFVELLYEGNPFSGGAIGSGQSLTFVAQAPLAALTEADFAVSFAGSTGIVTVDPPIPDTPVPTVPEPSSIALFCTGLLGLLGLTRFRRNA